MVNDLEGYARTVARLAESALKHEVDINRVSRALMDMRGRYTASQANGDTSFDTQQWVAALERFDSDLRHAINGHKRRRALHAIVKAMRPILAECLS